MNRRKSESSSNNLLILLIDLSLINLGFWFSYLLRYRLGIPYPVEEQYQSSFAPFIPYTLLLSALCLLIFSIDGLYKPARPRRVAEVIYRLFFDTMAAIVIIMAITFFLQPLYYSRGMLLLAGGIVFVLLSACRIIERQVIISRYKRGINVERVLVVGAGEIGRAVMRNILAEPGSGYQLIGYVDDNPVKGEGDLGRIRGLGDVEQIRHIIPDEAVDMVIVTLPWTYHRKIMQIVEECERKNTRVRVVPDVFQQRMNRIDMESLSGIPLIGLESTQIGSGVLVIKRVIDLFVIMLGLPVILIPLLIVALLVKLDSPGPVFFKHRRVGKDGKEFDLYKFRSMVVGADKMQQDLAHLNQADGPLFKIKTEDDPRVTRVGRFIRRASLDEFPQLINVLRGEMSLVGPRPGTPAEVEQYEPWQQKRLEIVPGITGLWQVSGRSDIPFDEMCLLDIFYIENWSLDLEIRILIQTIPRVLSGSGAY